MADVIDRPETSFDGPSHTYGLEGWNDADVMGVSSVAKVGEAEDAFGIASAWGFRVGYEGAYQLAVNQGKLRPFDVRFKTRNGEKVVKVDDADTMRDALQGRGLTPWARRDSAQERGNWTHDVLERLAADLEVPVNDMGATEEIRGHVRAVLAWYIKYRPSFVATEVQVASRTHGFAGRYDIRAHIDARKLVGLFEGHDSPQAERVRHLAREELPALTLDDLKTSKRVYPTSHFPQLAGYELASVEMGFPPTDCQLVLNTHPDGTYEFVPSWAQGEDFVAYLGALRAIRRIKREDPEEKRKAAREQAILAALPALSRDLAATLPELTDFDAKGVGIILGSLRKRGLVTQDQRKVWQRA